MPRKKKHQQPEVPVVQTPTEVPELRKKGVPNEGKVRLTKEAERILSGLGITPAEMAREASEELMTPKMALVGCLQTIQKICEVSTANIMNSVGPLNIPNLGTLFGGLRGTLALAEKITMNYARVQAALRAKDLMDAIQKKIRDAQTGSQPAPEAPGEAEELRNDPTDEELKEFNTEGSEEQFIGVAVDDSEDPRLAQLFEVNRNKKPKILN